MQFYESNISDMQIETCNMPREANKLAHLNAYILLSAFAYVNEYIFYTYVRKEVHMYTERNKLVLLNNLQQHAERKCGGFMLQR